MDDPETRALAIATAGESKAWVIHIPIRQAIWTAFWLDIRVFACAQNKQLFMLVYH